MGQPVTDTATLTTPLMIPARRPGRQHRRVDQPATLGDDADGMITFTLYRGQCVHGPGEGTGTNRQTVPVSGDGTYGPVSFIPDAPGKYNWVASYSGDLPNTLASAPSACLDANEDVMVAGEATLTTAQDWLPNDTATITGPTNLNGTLTFTLYTGGDCGATRCSGSRAVLQLHAGERAVPGGSDHDEHHVQGHGRERRRLLVARALRRHHPDRSADRCETSTVSITD